MSNTTKVRFHDWQASPSRAIFVWSISLMFVVMQFILQLSLGVVAVDMREALKIDALQISLISASYYVIYVILQTPAGILIDRYGSKKLLTIGSFLTFIGCLLFGFSNDILVIFLGRILCGGGMAFGFIASFNVAAGWFPLRYFSIMVALIETLAMFAALGGNVVIATLLDKISWRSCYIGMGTFVLFLGGIAWMYLSDKPKARRTDDVVVIPDIPVEENLFFELLKSKIIWVAGIYCGFCYTIVTVYAGLWGISFLENAYVLDHKAATFASSLVYAGLGIGAPILSSKIFARFEKKYLLAITPLISALFLLIIIYFTKISYGVICCLHFSLGFFAGILVQSYSITASCVPPRARNTAVGMVNTFALGTAPVFQAMLGLILERQSEKISAIGHEIYDVGQYQNSLLILPAILFIAAFLGYYADKYSKDAEELFSKKKS